MALFIVERVGAGFTVRPGENTLQAAASALTAEAWADAAALSSATAEAASGPTYASTAAGLAATTSGQSFAVDAGGGLVSVYLNSAGTAVLQRTLATTAYLASTAGAGAIGFVQSGTGAVARTMQAKAREVEVSITDFSGVSVGVSDSTAGVQNALYVSAADGVILVVPPGDFSVGALNVPANAYLRFRGGRFVANASGRVLTISGDNATIQDAHIDLDNTATCGVYASGRAGVRVIGTTRVSNAKTGGSSQNGAVVLQGCDDAEVGDIDGSNLYSVGPGSTGAYRGLEASGCARLSAGKINVRGGDIGFFPFNCTDSHIEAVNCWDITDNGIYLANGTRDIEIDSVFIAGCGEGIVFYCDDAESGVQIGSAVVRDASVKGVTLRSGGGYHIGSLTLIEAQLAQSTAYTPSVSGLTIGSLRVYNATNTLKPVVLEGNRRITIGSFDLFADAPSGGDAMRLIGCDRVMIGQLRVIGFGASPVSAGLRIEDGSNPVANPYILVNQMDTENVTTPYVLNQAGKGNVVINYQAERYGNLLMRSATFPKITLRSNVISQTAGNTLGAIEAYNSDTSSPGVKNSIEFQAAGGNGGGGQMIVKNDAGATVAIVPTGSGFSPKLPTSTTGLASGMIWNDAGTIKIVP